MISEIGKTCSGARNGAAGYKCKGGCIMTNKLSLKEQLLAVAETIEEPKVLVVAVELPTGAIEIITNTSNIDAKLEYYTTMYDDEFRLRTNPKVRIVGAMIV